MSIRTLDVNGVRFNVTRESDGVWIQHPLWSLLGHGTTPGMALDDLYKEAREFNDAFKAADPTTGDAEFQGCVKFCAEVSGRPE